MQSFLKVGSAQFEALGVERAADFIRGTDLVDFALMDKRDAMAAFGLIEIRSGDEDGETFSREVRDGVPKFPAGYGIDAGRRFIEKKDVRLGNQGADERELLLHATAQLAGETRRETIHVEGLQVAAGALVDVGFRDMAQLADIANVFHDAEVEIETEGLREVAGLRTGCRARACQRFARCPWSLPSRQRGFGRWWFCRRRRRRSVRKFRHARLQK